MTGDVARLRRLIAVLRELADRLADEVERVEEQRPRLTLVQVAGRDGDTR